MKALLACVLLLLTADANARMLRSKEDQRSSHDAYLQRVLSTHSTAPPGEIGSLWRIDSTLANLVSDAKAHGVGDIVSIVISEGTSSSSTGDVKGSRSGSASAQITDLGGKLSAKNALSDLYGATSNSALHGQGAATFANALQTLMSATVIAKLQNGDLVLEGTRNLDIEHQRQTVTIRGVVRVMDIRSDNAVVSNALADLEIEVRGKGTVSDFTRPMHPLFRFILKWFSI